MRIINAVFLLDFNENVRGHHPPLNIWCVLSYSLRKFHRNICRKATYIDGRKCGLARAPLEICYFCNIELTSHLPTRYVLRFTIIDRGKLTLKYPITLYRNCSH